MSVRLFKHNQMAYEAVRRMLAETGKAAVIHPTGTGKTYIAFRLVEDCRDKKFLWLSPSEYIFRTQLEQLLAQDPDFPKERITFLTYARLLTIFDEELAALCPDTIILDEFHRCGARVWGERLQRVLQMYPDAEILGLSATAIRYLDNDRDMAEELFDKNVASEITLGEAIVKGILKAPVYVSAVYDSNEILQRYQTRIRNQRGRGLQEQNQKYLEALRRSLEMSEGLEQIFQKYLTDPSGKYLVFCANVEHLTRMKELAGKWFGAIDKAPHIYSVYADSPQAMEEYNSFQTDSSKHLKLLYCIDMLNEGVHVKGISGVILFRPTVSPTIYKQQIGRALTAGEEKSPLIIDVVNNAESLCSIDVLKKEMAEAVCHLRREGQDEEIVTEAFTIEEQVEDCRKLFQQLEASLSSGWEQYFQAAKAYSKEHGHTLLEMPRHYVSPEGLSVGNWIETQKLVRSGKQPGVLTKEQIHRLDGIGMVWESRQELKFEKSFQYAKEYYESHGDLLVPASYRTADGFRLGTWISNLRLRNAKGEHCAMLSEAHRKRLDSIGMVWDLSEWRWEKNYAEALAYVREHGSLAQVPAGYCTKNGFALANWLQNLRYGYQEKPNSLTAERIEKLEALGMRWESQFDLTWMEYYQSAKTCLKQLGSLEALPDTYVSSEGLPLGKWLNRQKLALQQPEKSTTRLTEKRICLLKEIGIFMQDPTDNWEQTFSLLQEYQKEYGTLDLSQDEKYHDVWLGKWLSLQKKAREEGRLSPVRAALLESIGYDWKGRSDRQWESRLQEAEEYFRNHGHLQVTRENNSLRRWLIRQNTRHARGQLKAWQIRLLEQTGMKWNG